LPNLRVLLVCLCLAGAAAAGDPEPEDHDVTLVLDPEAGTFRSEDRFTVSGAGRLVVTAPDGVTVENGDVEVADGDEVVVRFRGPLRDGVLRGGFLVPGARHDGYRLTVTVPLPYRAVSNLGRRLEERESDGMYTVVYLGGLRGKDPVVATDRWTVEEESVDGTAYRVYRRSDRPVPTGWREVLARRNAILARGLDEFPSRKPDREPGQVDLVETAAGWALLGTEFDPVAAEDLADAMARGWIDNDAFALYLTDGKGGADAAFRRAIARRWSLGVGSEVERQAMNIHMYLREHGARQFVQAVALGADPWDGDASLASAPVLAFGPLKAHGNRVTGTIVQKQEGAPCRLRVPLRVTTESGVEEHAVLVAARETAFSVETEAAPRRLELDPEHHVFRLTPRDELSPALDSVGGEPKPARPGAPELRRAYPTFQILESGFRFRGETYGPDDGILLVCREGAFLHGRTGELPRHDSWAIFRDGKMIARGSLPGDTSARADISPARTGDPEPLVADLFWLTDSARRAGTMAAQKVANTLRGRLFRAGLKPIAWPTVTMIEGVAEKERTVALDGAGEIEEAFYPFHLGAETKGPVKFARVVEASAADVKGTLVLLPEDADEAAVRALAERGAAAVALVASEPTFAARGEEAAWVGAIPRGVLNRLWKQGLDVKDESLIVRRLMAATRGKRFAVPCVYLAPDAAGRLREHGKAGELRYSTGLVRRQTSNILGAFGDPRRPGLLLTASWDAADGPGAAGVAVLLDVAARLQRDHEAGRLKRPVVVALLGGTTAGYWGARQLVQALRTPGSPVARPEAILHLGTGARVALQGEAPGLAETFERAAKLSRLEIAAGDEQGPDATHAVLTEVGVPLLTVTAFEAARRDDLAHVDVDEMRRVANALYRTARELAAR
jgi:hypothetical protein